MNIAVYGVHATTILSTSHNRELFPRSTESSRTLELLSTVFSVPLRQQIVCACPSVPGLVAILSLHYDTRTLDTRRDVPRCSGPFLRSLSPLPGPTDETCTRQASVARRHGLAWPAC